MQQDPAKKKKEKKNPSGQDSGAPKPYYEFFILKSIDVLMVLVLAGVLMALVLPALLSQIEKSRAREAIQALTEVRGAMVRYYQSPQAGFSYARANFENIHFDPNLPTDRKPLFSYRLANLTKKTFTCTAQRLPIAGNEENHVSIDQAGTVIRNGTYR